MLSVSIFFTVAAAICAVLNAISPSRCPLWVSVILICVVLMLMVLPK